MHADQPKPNTAVSYCNVTRQYPRRRRLISLQAKVLMTKGNPLMKGLGNKYGDAPTSLLQ
jgi:hypothetical protein